MKYLGDPSSGSQAGTTASRNRFGQYKRTRAVPVQPRTPKATNNRMILTAGSSGWRSESDATRTAWNDYAAQITRSDRLGSGYSPTGAALYAGSRIASGNGWTPPQDPPSILPNYVLVIESVTYVDPTPGPEAFNVGIAQTDANNFFLIETSGPVSPGITSAAAVRRWRSLPASALNLTPRQYAMSASTVNFLAQYNFLFPSPVVGQVIWFRFSEIFYDGASAAAIVNRSRQTFRFVTV